MTGRVDPIVNPGVVSSHVHTVMGANKFGVTANGQSMRESTCTTALIKEDLSAYWFPSLYFQDPKDGHFEPVEMFYFNTYYFFEASNDPIKAFPVGLKMVSGNATTRVTPNRDGTQNLDPSKGPVNPLQWTCPRSNFNPPSWPAGSDGSKAGIQDPNNQGSGVGFPFANCDGYASPLRMDLHFPSCYNPAAGLENFKTNSAFPTDAGNGKHDCPAGWIHVPHIFFEVYWNTPKFIDRWTPNQGSQPFVLSNGDVTGFSGHGDFLSGWREDVLQQIIDNCDAGTQGMDKCPGLIGGVNDPGNSCTITSPIQEAVSGSLGALPGNNPVSGWGKGSAPVSQPVASDPVIVAPQPVASTPSNDDGYGGSTGGNTGGAASSAAPAAAPAPTSGGDGYGGGDNMGNGDKTVVETFTTWMTTTVYEDAGPTATPVAGSKAAIAGFEFAGCFSDGRERTLDGEIRPNLGKITNTACVTYCKSKGWALAGTEYGGQCYCGNELKGATKKDDSACDMPCEGNGSETCGGDWSLSVFSANGSATVAKARRSAHLHEHRFRRSGPSARLR
jgi:hypothetical protein